MKKLALALLLLSFVSFGYAQTDNTTPPPPPATSTPPPPPSAPAPASSNYAGSPRNGDNLGFRFGLQFSPEIVWMKSQDKIVNSSSPKFGFSYGLMFDYNIARRYAFSTGLYITQVSSSISYNSDSTKFNSFKNLTYYQGTRENFNKIQYIEIPLSIKLKTNEIGYLTYFGQFGFIGGLKIKTRGDISDISGKNNKVDENLGPDVTVVNLSLLIGAGLEYSLTSSTSAYVSLNFENGFLDATNNPSGYTSKAILNQLALRVGIFF